MPFPAAPRVQAFSCNLKFSALVLAKKNSFWNSIVISTTRDPWATLTVMLSSDMCEAWMYKEEYRAMQLRTTLFSFTQAIYHCCLRVISLCNCPHIICSQTTAKWYFISLITSSRLRCCSRSSTRGTLVRTMWRIPSPLRCHRDRSNIGKPWCLPGYVSF